MKDQIYIEVGKLLRCVQKSIKLDNELGEKLRKLIFLERRLQEKSTESKISQFRSIFSKKSRSETRRSKLFMKREKIIKFHKFLLIY